MDSTPVVASRRNKWVSLLFIASDDIESPVTIELESTRELDAQRWAKLYDVPYLELRGRVNFDSELLALACTAAKRLGKVDTPNSPKNIVRD